MKKIIIALVILISFSLSSISAEAQNRIMGFENLAEGLIPSVVNISTVTKIKKEYKNNKERNFPHSFDEGPFRDFLKEFNKQFGGQRSFPRAKKTRSLGSGFIIDAEKGYVITNNHVIDGADEIEVILDDNTNIEAKVIGIDKKTDIAVLQIKTKKKLISAQWGDSDKLRIGSWVLAIGNPFGFGGTVTAGIVSARQRNIYSGPYDEYIQTDASINKGNSGGPMFNVDGKVVGINTAIFSPNGSSVGIGFAVPANLAKHVVNQLIKFGKTKRGWLGVQIQRVTPEIAENIDLDKARGAMVSGITEDGPAKKAGIRVGDVILEFNGENISEMRELPILVAEADVGKEVKIKLWRKSAEKDIRVKLGQLEKAEEEGLIAGNGYNRREKKDASIKVKRLGISVTAINKESKFKYSLKADKGLVVTKVEEDSDADEKGIRVGDVILGINQKSVSTLKNFLKTVKKEYSNKKSSVLLFVSNGRGSRFVAIKMKK